ncbi:MAG: hypothetical protein F4X75_20575 [Gemmatimonadetes bacterium]|nr:hypothetical protein [Gemmatimonadota bacterium]
MTIALSAHPALNPLVGQLADALPIKGLYYPASRKPNTDLPFFSDLPAILQATSPRVCAFLSPYADLHNDVRTCLQSGVAVLCAGPVPKADQPIATGGIHRGSPLFAKALQQRRNPSFAEPVYLRLVAGAQEPGLLPAWWAICRQLAFASDLLGETPSQVHLCANRHGRAYQVALTATAPSSASIQLVVAPQPAIAELTLLGRGGVISSSAVHSGIALASAKGTHVVPDMTTPPAELAWLRDFLEKENAPSEHSGDDGQALLSGLRRALRTRQPVLVNL